MNVWLLFQNIFAIFYLLNTVKTVKGDADWCTEDKKDTVCKVAAGKKACQDLCLFYGVTDAELCRFVTDCTTEERRKTCPITCHHISKSTGQKDGKQEHINTNMPPHQPPLLETSTSTTTLRQDLNRHGEPEKCNLIKCNIVKEECSKTLEMRCKDQATTDVAAESSPPREPIECQKKKENIDCAVAWETCPTTCNKIALGKMMTTNGTYNDFLKLT